MAKKARVIIRMGASRWTASVQNGDDVVNFNLREMDAKGQNIFRKELTKAFREAGVQQ